MVAVLICPKEQLCGVTFRIRQFEQTKLETNGANVQYYNREANQETQNEKRERGILLKSNYVELKRLII